MELKNKVISTASTIKLIIEHVIKKILEQKINVTLEEILSISPTFIDKLKNLTTQEKEVIKSVNTSNIQERLFSAKPRDYDTPRLHYSLALGFMEVFIGREEYPTMALVDTVSEINIISEEIAIKASLTSRKLNMNIRGVGGHTTSMVGLSEFTPSTMITGEEKEIHLLIAKGAVHTILGRPFLADNNVKLVFSNKQGKYLLIQSKMDVNYIYRYVTLKPWVGKFFHPVVWSFEHLQRLENGQYIKQNHSEQKKQRKQKVNLQQE
ncbi:hypothetical protein O181_004420 [Austropuccinia psidii MF-1]|uniref:Retropepsins domain-containing protein n=1 Tax=Austropuccinia psidii MF-1 TaxID=1389203 RepID=A0A9Q3BGC6_9BASI|nr:hypothetical protein [Austropuccinia psidii MF-1]